MRLAEGHYDELASPFYSTKGKGGQEKALT